MALRLSTFFLFLLLFTTSFAQTLNLKSGNYPIKSIIETISYEDLMDSKKNDHCILQTDFYLTVIRFFNFQWFDIVKPIRIYGF